MSILPQDPFDPGGNSRADAPRPGDPDLTRRQFVALGGATLAGTLLGVTPLTLQAAPAAPRRLAILGTGIRGLLWGKAIVKDYGAAVRLVGLGDINPQRAKAARRLMGVSAPVFSDLETMVRDAAPDLVLIATVDAAHSRDVVRGLELGCDILCEKPLCTDAAQMQAILQAQARSPRRVLVTHNARHYAETRKMKALLLEKAIGEVVSVDYHEYLDADHGASSFRRWHRLTANSGSLFVTKACHHFDQINWLLDALPVEVSARGELRVYGRNGAFRSSHCRACPHTARCPYYWDITRDRTAMALYADCEQVDGYLRDGCVFRPDTDIHDSLCATVTYDNGVLATYSANAFLPYEGQAMAFNGNLGRLEWQHYAGGGQRRSELRLARTFGASESFENLPRRQGGHDGADPALMDMLFLEGETPDPLALRADLKQGARAALVGIACLRSIAQGGRPVRLEELVRIS
jgi:predicted dehydrogenase